MECNRTANDDSAADVDSEVKEDRPAITEPSNDAHLVLIADENESAPLISEEVLMVDTAGQVNEETHPKGATEFEEKEQEIEAKSSGLDDHPQFEEHEQSDPFISSTTAATISTEIIEEVHTDTEGTEEIAVNTSLELPSSLEVGVNRVPRTSTDDIRVTNSQFRNEDATDLRNRRSSEPTRTTAIYLPEENLSTDGFLNINLPSYRLGSNSLNLLPPPRTTSNQTTSSTSQRLGMMMSTASQELGTQLLAAATAAVATTARAQPQDSTNVELPSTWLQQQQQRQQQQQQQQQQQIANAPDVAPRRPPTGSLPSLPPLQPQPVSLPSPPQRRRRTNLSMDTDDNNIDDDDDDIDDDVDGDRASTTAAATESYSRFRCPICYEYMTDPASCGFCSTRFCWECLCRVAVRLDHAHRSAFGSAKCPTCREIFSIGTIRRDLELKEEIQCQVVNCPYSGCGKAMQLHELAGHEATCAFCTLKCRFATVGCPWAGRRSELTTHETCECKFYPLRQWIEQTRQTSHDHAQQLLRAHEEITSLTAMVEAVETSELLVRQQVKCPNNPLHLVEYTVVSLCTTPLLIFYSREVWRYFHHSEQARGTVFNFLTMLPTQLLLISVTACGYGLFVQQMNMSSTADWNKEQLDRVVDIFLSFSLTLLWILLLSAMYVDGQSSLDWRVFQAPGFLMDNMMNHVVSLGMLAAHFAVWQFMDSARVGWMIWVWTIFSSTFVPAVVSSISLVMNRTEPTWPERPSNLLEVPNPSKVLLTGRAGNGVMFGLRYGVLAASVGIIPTIDATILLFALRDFIPQLVTYHWVYAEANEPLLAWIPQFSPLAQVVVAVRLAMEARVYFHNPNDSTFQDSLLAIGCLLLVNQFTLRLIQVGALLGSAVASTWTTFDQADAAPERDYSAFGMTVFGVWSFSLAAIAMSTSYK